MFHCISAIQLQTNTDAAIQVGMRPSAPATGSISDMENLTIQQKLSYLEGSPSLLCHQKLSLAEEHSTWRQNGLSTLDYELLSTTDLSQHCKKYTVDVKLNAHWTDRLCGQSSTVDDHEAVMASLAKKKPTEPSA